ncbi:hypothetical protein, partial [Hydrogenophaga sp.]|uniref:hypothetical protein n=1 Tax=Hydrogenophaga sp. TaxID=1904254 RepID=UPI0025BBADAE
MSDFGLGSAGKNKATLDFAAGDTGTAMKVIILSIAFIALVATVSTVATVALIDLFPNGSIMVSNATQTSFEAVTDSPQSYVI